jgi:hypothetical protein
MQVWEREKARGVSARMRRGMPPAVVEQHMVVVKEATPSCASRCVDVLEFLLLCVCAADED